MIDGATRRLVEAVHLSPVRFVIVVTGGGSSTLAALLGVPGASRTVLEALVPYTERALESFLCRRPARACSAETGALIARRALDRARAIDPDASIASVAGVACTAALATDRPKRGEHRFFAAVALPDRQLSASLRLDKGARDRDGEEAVLNAVLLNLIAEAAGIPDRLDPGLLPGEELERATTAGPDALASFLAGSLPAVCVEPDGRVRAGGPLPAVLLPGSFNPLHAGHVGLADLAAARLGRPVAFELCAANVDKPPLTAQEIRRRVAHFAWLAPVWVTRAPTFADKAALFPGCTFLVGSDTAERIVMPRYYGGAAGMTTALGRLRAAGCRFLVAGRVGVDGSFRALADLGLAEGDADLFDGLPEDVFRLDLSSTALRAGRRFGAADLRQGSA